MPCRRISQALCRAFFSTRSIDAEQSIKDAIEQPSSDMNSTQSEEPVKPEAESIIPDKESELLPQIGDHIRLAESVDDAAGSGLGGPDRLIVELEV